MKKIDLIIDALSVAQNSVWSEKIAEALEAARELKAIAPPRKEWVGLTDDDHEDFANRTKLLPILAKTMAEFIEAKLKKKNT
jgi:hypothetical protein